MISGSGRYSDKSVGLCQVEERAAQGSADQLPTARASFVSSRLGIGGIDQTPLRISPPWNAACVRACAYDRDDKRYR